MPEPPQLIYPFRTALMNALSAIIDQLAAPTMNALFDAVFADIAGDPKCSIPQFGTGAGLTNIRVGDLLEVSSPVICIVAAGSDIYPVATNTKMMMDYVTEIRLKLPVCGLGRPEDFSATYSIVEDCLIDTLSVAGIPGSGAGYVIDPNGWGSKPLPAGSKFRECGLIHSFAMSQVMSAEGARRCPGWTFVHKARTDNSRLSPYSLGNVL
jgi:hypothetical protein